MIKVAYIYIESYQIKDLNYIEPFRIFILEIEEQNFEIF